MFGYLRFILATLVLLSHAGYYCNGVDQGVVSVVLFYMLAGYVVTQLLDRVFENGPTLLFRFYLERMLRIYPLYLFVLIITVTFIAVSDFGRPEFRLFSVLCNFFLVPLNYFMLFDMSILQEIRKVPLVPPSWSLGAEMQAYILLPFIVRYRPLKGVLALGSIVCFAAAALGFIHTDTFGYRLLPGVLFIFILGSCIYTSTRKSSADVWFEKILPPLCFVACVFALLALGFMGRLAVKYSLEVLLGMLIGIPVITYISLNKFKLRYEKLVGDLSYGVFLAHFLGIWTLKHFVPTVPPSSKWGLLYILTFAVALSLVGIWSVEKPCWAARRMLAREKNKEAE